MDETTFLPLFCFSSLVSDQQSEGFHRTEIRGFLQGVRHGDWPPASSIIWRSVVSWGLSQNVTHILALARIW